MEKNIDTLQYCFGICSNTNDNKHIFMGDVDGKPDKFMLASLESDLLFIQQNYGLSDIYIIESTNGYNFFSLDKMNIGFIRQLLSHVVYIDNKFIELGVKRNYLTLRVDKDKIYCKVLKSSGCFIKSNAHRLFFNIIFDIDIKKDSCFDNQTIFRLVEYASKKHGYFKDSHMCNNNCEVCKYFAECQSLNKRELCL